MTLCSLDYKKKLFMFWIYELVCLMSIILTTPQLSRITNNAVIEMVGMLLAVNS